MSRSLLSPAVGQYDPRLSDWSKAGYHEGQTPPTGSPITFGPGVHVLTQQQALASGTVLKGAGIGVTILEFPQPLSVMVGQGEDGGTTGWSWGGGVLQAIAASEVGIEDLTIRFPKVTYAGHHKEVGYNGISFKNCHDCWVRNVEILNADNGLFFEGTSTHLTAINIILKATRGTSYGWSATGFAGNRTGHHGIELQRCADSLVDGFDIQTTFLHDVGTENAWGNVYRRGKGIDLNFDHHRSILSSHHNLWEDIEVGMGNRVFASAGPTTDPTKMHSKEGNVFWNIRRNGQPLNTMAGYVAGPLWSPKLYLVGWDGTQSLGEPYLEQVVSLEPSSLYAEQRGEAPVPTPELPPEPDPMPTQKFQIGNTVRCNTQSNIRSSPGIQTDNKLGTQPLGATGTVVEGPVPAGAHTWWRINFGGGVDGWCGEGTLNQ